MQHGTSPYSSLLLINNAGLNWTPDVVPSFNVTTTPHEQHPSLVGLVMLVFEAVLEVICVSFPGYILARQGLFKPEHQKFVANLNMWLFTPCLIFSKLAKQLNPNQLGDLAVIPIIFVIQTAVSYGVSICVSKLCRFEKRATNFVTAMSVFGNSNSLPISLVISLSQTLKGLSWDRIQGDHSGLVSSRGILYLLIFQQLGQMVRWSWGFHVLLAKKEQYEEHRDERTEEGRYRDDIESGEVLIPGLDGNSESSDDDTYVPAGVTPVAGTSGTSPADSDDEASIPKNRSGTMDDNSGLDDIMSFPRIRELNEPEAPKGIRGFFVRSIAALHKTHTRTKEKTRRLYRTVYYKIPRGVRLPLEKTMNFVSEFMNPPLWAMLLSIVVASIPSLQGLFFAKGSFVKNSVTDAITQSGGVAVPLILVVLGANLANNTKENEVKDSEEAKIGTRLLIASLVSRMVLPTLIMTPILALIAKHIPVSILDDPIFIVVCFLLTGAPSALQLAQICQINEVYEGVMSKILFQSYVVWILPSTLALVMLALETLEWAGV
ncbi:putative membrane transporter [Rosellinia necatrix]|uniref:Putative membrane transporter n=1 Tax=Rosellinia necatrix TaxID=77044 RepID=A0A1W2TGD1_ROSNE|nr:putative membrane transporter [Rosellinia necatrix]